MVRTLIRAIQQTAECLPCARHCVRDRRSSGGVGGCPCSQGAHCPSGRWGIFSGNRCTRRNGVSNLGKVQIGCRGMRNSRSILQETRVSGKNWCRESASKESDSEDRQTVRTDSEDRQTARTDHKDRQRGQTDSEDRQRGCPVGARRSSEGTSSRCQMGGTAGGPCG